MAFWENKKKHKEEIELQVIRHLIEQDSEDRELAREYIRYQIKKDKYCRILIFILFLIGILSFLFIGSTKGYEELSYSALIIYIFIFFGLIFVEHLFSEQKVNSFIKDDTLASYYMELFKERWSEFFKLLSHSEENDKTMPFKNSTPSNQVLIEPPANSGWGLGIVFKDGKIEVVHWKKNKE